MEQKELQTKNPKNTYSGAETTGDQPWSWLGRKRVHIPPPWPWPWQGRPSVH